MGIEAINLYNEEKTILNLSNHKLLAVVSFIFIKMK